MVWHQTFIFLLLIHNRNCQKSVETLQTLKYSDPINTCYGPLQSETSVTHLETLYLDCVNHVDGRTKPRKQPLQHQGAAAPLGLSPATHWHSAYQRSNYSRTCANLYDLLVNMLVFYDLTEYIYVKDVARPGTLALIAQPRDKSPARHQNLPKKGVAITMWSSSAALKRAAP